MNKIILSILFISILNVNIFAQKEILLNFNNLEIKSFIKITSKILNKNILIPSELKGKVEFVTSKKIYKKDILNILVYVLEAKGYTITENENILRIIRLTDVSKKIVEVIYLKNSESKNIIKIIDGIIKQSIHKNKNTKPFATTDDDLNSIILMGQEEELKHLKKLIAKLDSNRQQVYVKARIIEISEKATSNMGIKYGVEGLLNSGENTLTFAGNLGGPSFVLNNMTSAAVSSSKVRDGLILGASINLLKQNYALDLVSEPSLLCINNKESSIYVGESRSILTGTTVGTTTTTNYKREDIGLTLKVKPRISNGNKVTLEISSIMEDITETDTIGQPNTNKKEVQTTAIVTNGESVILGGLIKNKKESTVTKVPFFGDLPLLGSLFRNKSELRDKINLVIIITPYIIPKSEDLTYIRNQLAELKLLEDKYTKETIIRLEKAKQNAKKEDLSREKEIHSLYEVSDDLQEKMLNISISKKDYHNKKENKEDNLSQNERLHQERVNEILGI